MRQTHLICILIIFMTCAEKTITWGIPRDDDAPSRGQNNLNEEIFSNVDSSLQRNQYIERGNINTDKIPMVDPAKRTVGLNHAGVIDQSLIHDRNRMQYLTGRKQDEASEHGYLIERRSTIDNGSQVAKNNESEAESPKRLATNSREVLETQHATCQVTTEELVATAQATVTRVLKGLCNAKQMEDRIHNLETQLTQQLNIIKTMILNIEDKIGDQEENIKNGQKKLFGSLTRHCSGLNLSNNRTNIRGVTDVKTSQPLKEVPLTQELDVSTEISDGPRDLEVVKFNSTIHMESSLNGISKKAFSYYWRIKHMEYKLTGWNSRRSLRSQSFYVYPRGYRMYLRIYPRQKEENFFVHVGVTKGDFDDSLPWPFPLKHRVLVLDQTRETKSFEDITSRIWDPKQLCSEFNWQKPASGDNYECVGLGFPHDVLRQGGYIRSDSIIIKLVVYLDV